MKTESMLHWLHMEKKRFGMALLQWYIHLQEPSCMLHPTFLYKQEKSEIHWYLLGPISIHADTHKINIKLSKNLFIYLPSKLLTL